MSEGTKKRKRGINVQIRLIIVSALILLQFSFVVVLTYFLSSKALWIYFALQIISIVMVIYIVIKKGNPSYKITWIIYILVFPLFGGLFYLIWGGGRVFPHMKRRMKLAEEDTARFVHQDKKVEDRLYYTDMLHARQSRYLKNESGFPVYENTECEYLSPGEVAFPKIIEELKKAEQYIFIEFFILAEGTLWDEIHAVLREKVKAGVEVRIMFDDFGSVTRQYRRFSERLRNEGIKVTAFNRIRPSIDMFMNNRNHRKIILVDGKVAVTGGINIADEYVNRITRFGYWMDCAILLRGEAVRSFVVMFCTMWAFNTGKKLAINKYLSDYSVPTEGFAQPYCDSPINDKNPAEGIYMQILNTAQKYVYIVTPYLIVDNTMISELTLAAKSGIDVRIITPSIRDKWYVHPVTQYSYDELLSAGIRIYEYTPGFIHSKIFVSDDKVATVGTVNMDYRSFFFHFECGVWICSNNTVGTIKTHVEEIMKDSKEILLGEWKLRPIRLKIKQTILHLFAPFM